MNKVVTIFLFFYCSILFGQNNINSYKYILVPKQFEFQKSEDQYQLNSLSKFLFDKAGYKVLFTDEQYPNDLASNSCLGLKMVVNNSSSIFKTKMNIELYDCYNKIVFSTNEGTSRKKEYKKAYHEAIRSAFKDLEGIDYKYSGVTILASEDIGNANPTALILANNTFQVVNTIGFPESRIILSQCAIYLASSSKSNASYEAIGNAQKLVRETGDLPIPLHLRNAPTKLMKELDYGKDYKYAHSYENNFVSQEFLPKEIDATKLYEPGINPRENSMRDFLKKRWKDKYNY